MSTPDFGHLKPSRKDTSECVLYDYPKEPVLVVKFAGEGNPRYFNEMLRKADHAMRRKAKISEQMIRENRTKDRELFPKFVIVGWRNVFDVSGNEVPFSQENCVAFINGALDDVAFDLVREWAKDPSNFRDAADSNEIAGNS